MLGQRVGDEFEWQVPAGPVRLRVKEVLYQRKRQAISTSETERWLPVSVPDSFSGGRME